MLFFGLVLGVLAFGVVFIVLFIVSYVSDNIIKKRVREKYEEFLNRAKYFDALKLMYKMFDTLPIDDTMRKDNLKVIEDTLWCLEKIGCKYDEAIFQNVRSFTENEMGLDLSLKSENRKREYREQRALVLKPFRYFLKEIAKRNSINELKSFLNKKAH